MNNDKKGTVPIFKMPEDPRERAVWLRRWIQSLFKVYLSITDHAAAAMPHMKFEQMEKEAKAVKQELMNLIKPEKWEKEDEPGKDKI